MSYFFIIRCHKSQSFKRINVACGSKCPISLNTFLDIRKDPFDKKFVVYNDEIDKLCCFMARLPRYILSPFLVYIIPFPHTTSFLYILDLFTSVYSVFTVYSPSSNIYEIYLPRDLQKPSYTLIAGKPIFKIEWRKK